MFYISQVKKNDCGFACLKMLLADLSKNKDYLFISGKEENSGYSFQELIDTAKKYGVTLEGYQVDDYDELFHESKAPVILEGRDRKHAIIVKKNAFGLFEVCDPSDGKSVVTKRKLKTMTSGNCLVVEENSVEAIGATKEIKVSLWDKIKTGFLSFATAASCLMAVYFVDENFDPMLPLLFMSAFLLFQLLLILHGRSQMEKMEKQFFQDSEKLKKEKYQQAFVAFESLKAKLLSTPSTFISSVLILLSLIVIMVMNSTLNIIYVFISLLFALFSLGFVEARAKKVKSECAIYENLIDKSEDYETFKRNVSMSHKTAYRFSRTYLLEKMIELIVVFVAPAIMMTFLEIQDVSYVFIYACLVSLLIKYFKDALKHASNVDKINLLKCQYNEVMNDNDNKSV